MGDVTSLIDNYAVYVPALSVGFAEYVMKDVGRPGFHIAPRDLNFLQPDALWRYRSALASSMSFAFHSQPNIVTHRNPASSWILGDSGGFQIGTGVIKGFRARTPEMVARRWRSSSLKEDILRWLELYCDCAMTLDIPLWLRLNNKSPFQACSVELLTDLTVENLQYFADHRGRYGQCEFLNVLHGTTDEEEEYWFRRVGDFDFEGWAIGGSVAGALDMRRLLRRILLLRDQGMLGGRKRRLHVLGMSQITWAVALTAIQRAVQRTAGHRFTVSFDTSTPMITAGRHQRIARRPQFTNDIRTWAIPSEEFPNGHAAAVRDADMPFPPGSPLSSVLTLGDMNPNRSPYAAQTFDRFSFNALANHNTFVHACAAIEANRIAFGWGRGVPGPLSDVFGLIDQLFRCEAWDRLLTDSRTQELFGAAGLATRLSPQAGGRARKN